MPAKKTFRLSGLYPSPPHIDYAVPTQTNHQRKPLFLTNMDLFWTLPVQVETLPGLAGDPLLFGRSMKAAYTEKTRHGLDKKAVLGQTGLGTYKLVRLIPGA